MVKYHAMGDIKKENPVTESSEISLDGDYISADDLYKEVYGDFPKGSVYLSGLRYRDCLTQKQLSEMVNVKRYDISLMERGLKPIKKSVARRLAKVFNTDYESFL